LLNKLWQLNDPAYYPMAEALANDRDPGIAGVRHLRGRVAASIVRYGCSFPDAAVFDDLLAKVNAIADPHDDDEVETATTRLEHLCQCALKAVRECRGGDGE
jgi:hypothetical protein